MAESRSGSRLVLLVPILILAATGWVWNSRHRSFANVEAASYRLAGSHAGQPIDWLTLRNGTQLNWLSGQDVRLPGFVIPLESSNGTLQEFLLVLSRSCLHVLPPAANQTVLVRAASGVQPQGKFGDPVWVSGRLETISSFTRSGPVTYQISLERMEPYDQ